MIEERAEGGDVLFQAAQRDPHFLDGFERVAEGGGIALYTRAMTRDCQMPTAKDSQAPTPKLTPKPTFKLPTAQRPIQLSLRFWVGGLGVGCESGSWPLELGID